MVGSLYAGSGSRSRACKVHRNSSSLGHETAVEAADEPAALASELQVAPVFVIDVFHAGLLFEAG